MTDIIRSKADLCLEFRDAFNNQRIEAEQVDIQLWRNYSPFPLGKFMEKRRFLLLRNIGQGQIEIIAKAKGYEEKRCTVLIEKNAVQKLDEAVLLSDYVYTDIGMPILALCLYPDENYPLPEGYARRSIQGKPFEAIRTVINDERPIILMEDYQGGNILRVNAGNEAVGGVYRIKDRDGQWEDFAAVTWGEKELMLPDVGLSGHYSRGSRLYSLYESVADAAGNAAVICRGGCIRWHRM